MDTKKDSSEVEFEILADIEGLEPAPEVKPVPVEAVPAIVPPVDSFYVGARVYCHDVSKTRDQYGSSYVNAPSCPQWGGKHGHRLGEVLGLDLCPDGTQNVRVLFDGQRSTLTYLGGAGLALANAGHRLLAKEKKEAERMGERQAEAKASEAESDAIEEAQRKERIEERQREQRERVEKQRPEGNEWPEAAKLNREAWLAEAARRLARTPEHLVNVLFSVGYGKGGTRGEKTWSVSENENGKGWQVFVRPSVCEKVGALAAVIASTGALGILIRSVEHGEGKAWPEYPQPEIKVEHKAQATRLLKCECSVCGFTFRTTQKWLDSVDGSMRCVSPVCSGTVSVTPAKE